VHRLASFKEKKRFCGRKGVRGILGSYLIIKQEMDIHEGPDLADTQHNHSISGLVFNCCVSENLGQNPLNPMPTERVLKN